MFLKVDGTRFLAVKIVDFLWRCYTRFEILTALNFDGFDQILTGLIKGFDQILTGSISAGFDFCPAVRNNEKLVCWASYGEIGEQRRKKKIVLGWPWRAASLKLKTHVKNGKNVIAGNEITASSSKKVFRELNR